MSLMLTLTACTTIFTACSKDDDKNEGASVTMEQLAGTWEMTHISGWCYDENDEGELFKDTINMDVNEATLREFMEKDVADYCRYKFTADGQFNNYVYADGTWRQDSPVVPYTLNGSTITINPKSKDEEQLTVLSISATQIVMREYDPEEFDLTITCKKID
jgi:hypothetical protein